VSVHEPLQDSLDKVIAAELAQRVGCAEQAQALYREAAEMQWAFVESLPAGRVNTKSVYGFSTASLLFKAGDLDAAERRAAELLQQPWCEVGAADGLRDLLMDIQAARRHTIVREKRNEAPAPTHAYVLTFDNVSKRKAEILDALCGTGLFTRGVAEHVVFYRGLFISRNAQFAARVANALSAIGVKCELDCKPVQRGVG
jgi:hypothetical protein